MASPMAAHWNNSSLIKVECVHDRGTPGERRDRCRLAWRSHGAKLVSSLGELIGSGDLDGVFVCCGKNGDDIEIIPHLAIGLSKLKGRPRFICHMSTVSTGFATLAAEFCRRLNVSYVNYPLTGGPAGAEAGRLLILASGDDSLFQTLRPGLACLGTAKHFGERVAAAAEVKFIGHIMVFNGLMGICSAAATHAECFLAGKVGGPEQTSFFDFLNEGAGGTRQWDLIARSGIRNDIWHAPFALKYGAIDAIYTARLCIDRRISKIALQSIFRVILSFSYVMNRVESSLATHAIVRELIASRRNEFDEFVIGNSGPPKDPEACLVCCIESLPPEFRAAVAIDLSREDFEAAAS